MVQRKLKEKCGIIGVYTASQHASSYAKQGLAALQHRGQESAGMSILTPQKKIKTYTGMGIIPHVLTNSVLKKLGENAMAIGHNRYATSGHGALGNAHPIEIKNKKYQVSIGHNGNIPELSSIRKKLGEKKRTISDTTLMARLLMQERPQFTSWEGTLINTLPEFKGAYNLVFLTNDGSLFGIRDPYGIRPLCLGKLPDGWVVASESVALDAIGAHFVRDIQPGEIIKITLDGKIESYFFGEPKRQQFCLFEFIYFARPDSFINGKRVRTTREAAGKLLGKRLKQKDIRPDVVVPTFDSGYPAAKGVAEELGLPIVDAITTSHYIGRTFIQPGQENRVAAVKGKHNIVPDDIIGKHVVIVDDSAVRLTTSTVLAREFKQAGAKKVTMAFASPPVIEQCDLGIDMRSKKYLPASQFENQPFEEIERQVASLINAHDVVYLPIEETIKAIGGTTKDFYHYPFGGPHPLRSNQEAFAKKRETKQGKPKIFVFISGSGTNLQVIIDMINEKKINAEIVAVLSNKEDAYGLTRAKQHHIPTIILPYSEKLNDAKARQSYEKKLIQQVQLYNPDIILLSGWTFILGDTFLQAMQKTGVPIINHHPALLSQHAERVVQTSRGAIPVIRGPHGFKDAYEKNLPVSGITVHQVLPGNSVDMGPIITKAEVRRKTNDTPETFEKRIREMEYVLLPTAIKRILHVTNHHNIDISKGDFPW